MRFKDLNVKMLTIHFMAGTGLAATQKNYVAAQKHPFSRGTKRFCIPTTTLPNSVVISSSCFRPVVLPMSLENQTRFSSYYADGKK